MNKYFNPNTTYKKAITDQDKVVLKALLVGIIGADPTFATTEFDEAMDYIKKSLKENGEKLILEEPYEMQEDEYEKDDWDEEYYKMQLLWFQDNFDLNKRLSRIKEIGKKIYQNKTTWGKIKKERNISKERQSDKMRGSKTKKKNIGAKRNNRGKSVKKVTVVRATGDDMKEVRLSKKGSDSWIKKYWKIIVIGVIVIFIFGAVIIFV